MSETIQTDCMRENRIQDVSGNKIVVECQKWRLNLLSENCAFANVKHRSSSRRGRFRSSELRRLGDSLRVMLADDHALVRAGIRAWLEKLPGVEVVGEASDGRREKLRWGNAPRLTPS